MRTDTMVALLGGEDTLGKGMNREALVEEVRRGLPASSVAALADGFALSQE